MEHELNHQSEYYSATCLMNANYCTLFLKKRTYAAFNDTQHTQDELTARKCAQILSDKGINEILDPMAGYGTLLQYGKDYLFRSYLVEINLPAHLWQLLVAPEYCHDLTCIIADIINDRTNWPKTDRLAEVSDQWIGTEGLRILQALYCTNKRITDRYFQDELLSEKLALAIMLPMVLRLSTAQKGDAVYIKRNGGVAILREFDEDYYYYLSHILLPFLYHEYEQYSQLSFGGNRINNTYVYDDAIAHKFPPNHFHGMLTSPPYPNGSDYGKMFSAEHYFIKKLSESGLIHFALLESQVIGSNKVTGRNGILPESKVANNFLGSLMSLKLGKKAKNDMRSYYFPYYRNYFYDVECAYRNISRSLASPFTGYIIVTNNAIRNIEVPVSDFIIEIWKNLGFEAECIKSKDVSHVGAKNPHSKGRMSLHREHIIKVWRGENVQ